MSTQTTNYGFTKDNENDFYNVNTVNNNLDKIDTEVKRIEVEAKSFNQHVDDNTKAIAVVDMKVDKHIKDDSGHVRFIGNAPGGTGMACRTDLAPVDLVNGKLIPRKGHAFRFLKVDEANMGPHTFTLVSDTLPGNPGSAAYPILNGSGQQLTGGEMVKNGIYTLAFNGTAFILQGESGVTVTRNGATYTTPGTYELIVPRGVSKITAYLFGAGGGGGSGGSSSGSGTTAGGGGGGGFSLVAMNVKPGEKLTIVVGAPGGGGSGGASGGVGGTTYIRNAEKIHYAYGGGGGGGGNSALAGSGGSPLSSGFTASTSVEKDGMVLGNFIIGEVLLGYQGGTGGFVSGTNDYGGGGGAAPGDTHGGKAAYGRTEGVNTQDVANVRGGSGGKGADYLARTMAMRGNSPGGGGGGGCGYSPDVSYRLGAQGGDGRVYLYW